MSCTANPINNILIIDSACDQSIISDSAFVVLSPSGTYFHINGALSGRMESETALEVVDAVTKVTLKDGSSYILQLNQSLIDLCSSQRESLLQPHQARAHGVMIDDCPTHHKTITGTPGSQRIKVADIVIPLLFDGLKSYLLLTKPTTADIEQYPRVFPI